MSTIDISVRTRTISVTRQEFLAMNGYDGFLVYTFEADGASIKFFTEGPLPQFDAVIRNQVEMPTEINHE